MDCENNSGCIEYIPGTLVPKALPVPGGDISLPVEVVDELPETGEEGILYLVPKEGSQDDIHNEYIWINEKWELIGSTAIDISGKLDAPETAGTSGQILALNDELAPVWKNMPNASATTKGVAKLYTDINGQNTDGAVTQKAVYEAVGNIEAVLAAINTGTGV